MSSSSVDNEIPQWKKDLIARLRSQNKRTATAAGRQLCPPRRVDSPVQQPDEAVAARAASERAVRRCEAKMVQEREKSSDSDSSEDLKYGPGIVNKLRNKYLSLAQRETASKVRGSILPLRKAASLEDLLDDAPKVPPSNDDGASNRRFDLKRARSVEAISRPEEEEEEEEVRREEALIGDGSDKPKIIPDKKMPEGKSYRVNRPKRIAPIMNEKEKPPADVVKQAKLIFERRPEQRTKPPQQTGEVAAKVANYKNIIGKAAKKPSIKVKPIGLTNGVSRTFSNEKQTTYKETERAKSPEKTPSLPSPIPDVSRIDIKTVGGENGTINTSLSETPDLIMTSSSLVNSPSFRIAATENFIREERRLSNLPKNDPQRSPFNSKQNSIESTGGEEEGIKKVTSPFDSPSNTMTFNFAKTKKSQDNHLPLNKNVLNTHTPPLQPLKLEINGINGVETKKKLDNDVPALRSPINTNLASPRSNLTNLEIEKNLINAAKTLEQPKTSSISIASVEGVTRIKVPKVKKPPRELENNTIVFKFTDRKDVPDYVHNDGVTRVSKIEKPKVGEGGIILLPGASIDESFTDEDEEIMRSLEGPPSPCDVTFINANILIDGKSSLSQKTKKAKMRISFVEAGPEIYEYPSESSLLIEDARHPSITGSSSLGNYTPKSTEEFQPGVTRSVQNIPVKPESTETAELILQEVEKPVLFSAGANSDILF